MVFRSTLTAFLLLLAAAAQAETVTVSQKGRAFAPNAIDIAAGDTVRIANDDEFIHHVQVADQGYNFDSGEQEPGSAVEIKPPHKGSYDVHCAIHPKMHLTVTVK